MVKKSIVTIVIMMLALGGLAYPRAKTEAIPVLSQICSVYDAIASLINPPTPPVPSVDLPVGGITKPAVPVYDPTVERAVKTESKAQQATQRKISCESFFKDVALSTLKKRLLDSLVDEIIEWIQGGGKPKFVEDFGGFLEEVGQKAVGDLALEIDNGRICKPFKLRLQVNLITPRFSQLTSCTLDQIVGNFEDFRNDFRNGGWAAFTEINKPQNNYYGTIINTFEEKNSRVTRQQDIAKQDIDAGQGFISVEECLEWTFEGVPTIPGNRTNFTRAVETGFEYYNVQGPPPMPDGYYASYSQWTCSRKKRTTPGTLIAHGAQKALYSDLDFIINADELSDYIGAIADAAINRLIKEAGVRGVQLLKKSQTSTGQPTGAPSPVPTSSQGFIDDYSGVVSSTINDAINNLSFVLGNASSAAYLAQTDLYTALADNGGPVDSFGGPGLIYTLGSTDSPISGLIICQNFKGLIFDPNATTTLANAIDTQPILSNRLGQIQGLISEVELAGIQLRNSGVTSALIQEITNLSSEILPLKDEATAFRDSIQSLLDKARTDLAACIRYPY